MSRPQSPEVTQSSEAAKPEPVYEYEVHHGPYDTYASLDNYDDLLKARRRVRDLLGRGEHVTVYTYRADKGEDFLCRDRLVGEARAS